MRLTVKELTKKGATERQAEAIVASHKLSKDAYYVMRNRVQFAALLATV